MGSALKVGLVLILVVSTIGLFDIDTRYNTVSDNLIVNGGFQSGLEGWDVLGPTAAVWVTKPGVRIRSMGGVKRGIRQNVVNLRRREALRVEAKVSTTGLVAPADRTFPGALRVVCQDGRGHRIRRQDGQFVVAGLPESPGQSIRYREVMMLPDGAAACTVEVYVAGATKGGLSVDRLAAFFVSERSAWKVLYYVLLTLWVSAALWITTSLIRSAERPERRFWWLVVACVVVLSSVVSKPIRDQIAGWAVHVCFLLRQMLLGQPAWPVLDVESLVSVDELAKMGHIVLFAFLTYAVRLGWPRQRLVVLTIYIAVFAASAEVLQYFAADRDPRPGDWLFDMAGVGLGLMVVEGRKCFARLVSQV